MKKTSIPGVLLIERPTFSDGRGFFHEIFRLSDLGSLGFHPIQFSHSFSRPGVIRGIHCEEWTKIMYPLTGVAFIALADLRPESKSFGKVETFIFENKNAMSKHQAIFIPRGVGNSICVIGGKSVHFCYFVDEYWDDSKAKGIAWDDPDLKIKWPIEKPIISERDKNNPTLRKLFPDKFHGK